MTTDWKSLHRDRFRGRRVLVTGGAGFIGSHLVSALLDLGADVVVLDDLSSGERENVPQQAGFIQGSVADASTVWRAAEGREIVFHEAALASVPDSVARPREFFEVNVTGTLNVLQAARDAKVRRVIFAASSSAYGDAPALPKTEAMSPDTLSPYAASKLAGETMMRAWSVSYGLDTVSLRYFNIFGPRQRADSAYAAVIAAFAAAMLKAKKPVIYGDGEQSRDFTYIDNAVHANLLAAAHPQPLGGQVFNVAVGQRVSLNQLAEVMRRALNRPDLTPVHEPPRAGDVRHSLADLTRIKDVLDYRPIADFEQGLAATLEWYRQIMHSAT